MAIDQATPEDAHPRASSRSRRSSEPAATARSAPGRTFKVIRHANGKVLAEGTDTRATIDVLTRVGSIFDVLIYVWESHPKAWRALTPAEQRTLWDFRARLR